MTDEKALTTTQESAVSTPAQDFETLKAAVGTDLTNSQYKLAVAYAQSVGADLFARQIYPVVDKGRLVFMTSIDFLRVIAERSGKYDGQGQPVYEEGCDCQGQPQPFSFPHPVWAEVPIYRKGWDHPVVRRAYFHEYVPIGYDNKVRPTWSKMPHVMLAKVSEAAAIRAAFPNDVKGLYTNDEMEQADAPDTASLPSVAEGATSGGQDAIEIPPDPEKPEWAKHEVKVREAPDGLRQVKTPDWYKGPGADQKHIEKLEIKGKYGRRNVTVILIGPVAVAADDHLDAFGEGVTIALDGAKYEYEWKEGKPKALQIRNASRLVIEQSGEWLDVQATPEPTEAEDVVEGQAVEVDPTPTPPTPSEPESPPSGTGQAGSPPAGDDTAGSSTATTEPEGKAPSAEPSSETPTEPTPTGPASDESGPTTPTSGDLTAQAQETFADMLDDDVDPARGGNPQVGEGWKELPVKDGPDGNAVSFEAYFAQGDLVDVPNAPGKLMYDAWLTSMGMDQRIHVLMAAKVAQTAGVERLGAGEQVYVRGQWKHPQEQPVVLADVLRPA